MPEVITAKTAGFCFGVKRAVDTVYEEIKKGGDVYTFGEIIHNESVVEDLEKKGVKVIENLDEISRLKEGTVIIRSHGVAKNVKEKMSENRNIRIVDATCPFVKKIHETVEKESSEGKDIIIIGDPDHPEVLGITGYVKTRAYAINSREEAENFNADKDREMCLVSQTTFNLNKFKDLVEILSKKGYSI
nr:4-hydroxy-3-methylbut-2-enyl diphosphate reductase [Lachnospiraceae bacterium]